jgi:hypothetical protein
VLLDYFIDVEVVEAGFGSKFLAVSGFANAGSAGDDDVGICSQDWSHDDCSDIHSGNRMS